jgi:hypothetical protein
VPRIARSAKSGSSKSAPVSKGGRRHLTNPTSDDSDIEELTAVGNNHESDGELEVVEIPPRSRKPSSRGGTATNGNGKQTAKAKGKARVAPQKSTRKPAPLPEPMDVDPIVIDEDEAGPGPGPSVMLAINSSGKNKRSTPPTSRSTKNGEASGVADQLRRVRTCVSRVFHA